MSVVDALATIAVEGHAFRGLAELIVPSWRRTESLNSTSPYLLCTVLSRDRSRSTQLGQPLGFVSDSALGISCQEWWRLLFHAHQRS